MAILATIAGLGLFMSFDFYKSYAFRGEKNTLVSVLQKARDQSLHNINQTRHGARVSTQPLLQYTLFECPASNPQCDHYTASPTDIIINSSYQVSLTSPAPPFDIIFSQLRGGCVTCQSENTIINVSDGITPHDISINKEGQIDW